MGRKEIIRIVLHGLSLAMGASGAALLFAEGSNVLALLGIAVACLAMAGLVNASK